MILVSVYSVCGFCACIYELALVIFHSSLWIGLFLCKASTIFLNVLQIILWSKHYYGSQQCLILTHCHLGPLFLWLHVIKSLFLFNPMAETSSNWSGASSVEASLYTSAALYNLST